MRFSHDPRPGSYRLHLHACEVPALAVALDDAIALGCDHGGSLSALRNALEGHLDEIRRLVPERPDPLLLLGPGGDYVSEWPPQTPELIGGDPATAVCESLPPALWET